MEDQNKAAALTDEDVTELKKALKERALQKWEDGFIPKEFAVQELNHRLEWANPHLAGCQFRTEVTKTEDGIIFQSSIGIPDDKTLPVDLLNALRLADQENEGNNFSEINAFLGSIEILATDPAFASALHAVLTEKCRNAIGTPQGRIQEITLGLYDWMAQRLARRSQAIIANVLMRGKVETND